MASYHLSVQVISRSGARSAVAAAAYRSRSSICDNRQGITFDYTKKQDLVHSEILLPDKAPRRLADRATLWNEVEAVEKRKDAQLAREIDVALPRELNLEQQKELVREFCREEFVGKGMIVDINIHHYQENPHAHIMLTLRDVDENGFGKKNRTWNKQENLNTWRRRWAEKTNEKLLAAGYDIQVDHRSFKDRGIDLIPQRHVGYNIKFVPKEYLRLEDLEKDNAREYAIAKWINGERIISAPDKALSYLTHQNVAFREGDIDRFLISHTFDDQQFHEAKQKMLRSTEIVRIGQDEEGKQLYTTQSMIEKEKVMLDQAKDLDLKLDHPVAPEIVQQTLANFTLNEEQKEAFRYVIKGGDISVVMGPAGTGKSYTLAAVREAYEAAGYRVQGIALSGIAAENLEYSSGIRSTTIYSKLNQWEKGVDLPAGKYILVVDEAGFVGTRQMHDIIGRIHQAGGKVIMAGDNEQLPAIEAGGAARGVMNRVGCCEMSNVRRQQTPWQAEATVLMSSPDHHMQEAIERYAGHGKVFEEKTRAEAMDRLVNDWKEYTRQNPDKSALIMTYSNKDVGGLNERARAEAREAGRLGEKERPVKTERGVKAFSAGDRIIFLENNKGMNVKNGSRGTILKIDDQSPDKSILVKLENGTMVSFDPRQYRNIDYGYAMTVHKSQGTTVDRSFVLATKRFEKHMTYVSMSRHREDATIYYGTNDFRNREALVHSVEKRNLKSLVEDFANHRGYETLEREADKFKEISIDGLKYFEVPKGGLQEPIKGEYRGDVKIQGKNYHQIKNFDNGHITRYIVPATETGVDKQLRLRNVIYDGVAVTKAPEMAKAPALSKVLGMGMERARER